MIILTLTCVTVILLYLKMRKSYKYWRNLNVLYVRPWPLFGYMAPNVLRLKAFPLVLQNVYNVFPEQRFFGAYQFVSPVLFIRSPDLIKKILDDDFGIFSDRRSVIGADLDPLWAKNLYAIQGGDKWNHLRSTLNEALNGEQLKNAFESMKICAKHFNYHFLELGGTQGVELRNVTSKFANDVIALSVFGISCNSLQNSRNDFYLMSKHITEFNLLRIFKLFGYSVSPNLMKFFKFRIIEKRTNQFYRNIVLNKNSDKKDTSLVDFLIKRKKLDDKDNNNTDILDDAVAQGIHFFFSGFETVSLAITFLLYELAINPEIQVKLRKEVDVVGESSVDLSYEEISNMEYLDMVVSESLRKWPPTVLIDRKCTQSFTVEAEQVWETTTTFNANTICLIPVFAIHRDNKHYPDPEKFDPERFSFKNRLNIKPATYIPFGFGPRNCVAFQFALLEIKTLVFYLLREFEIISTEKTRQPLNLGKGGFQLSPGDGVWVGFRSRPETTTAL